MFTAEYEGINSFLVGASSLLLKEGVKRKTRGINCIELPAPFMFKLNNPTSRLVTITERKWNPILPYAESLWLAVGRNDLEFIGHYLKNMKNFSDDGFFMRGGYGPRLRKYTGVNNDYKIRNPYNVDVTTLNSSEVDQFSYICKNFEKDINTRQAIINIGDPPKDCFDKNGCLKVTKDFPCTRLLHFQKNPIEDKLNLTVYMRSNDFMWGASAVNIFNYTFIQEYFAKILNLKIGEYFHITNNFHFYNEHSKLVHDISNAIIPEDSGFEYSKSFNTLSEFDEKIKQLHIEEEKLRANRSNGIVEFEDDFFNDWFKTFYSFNTKKRVKFKNPILNQLFKKYYTHE
ncbi:MAG: thymidylate synthase [Bacteroidetes bacterium]|nr:MAG: thymidylate synthase [Bacteroidota bacterium]